MPVPATNLGGALIRRFEQLGNVEDLKRAVTVLKRAVGPTADNDPKKPSILINLGIALLRQFEHLGEIKDLTTSVLRLEEAVQIIPANHTERITLFNNLGHSLMIRFTRLGVVSDIDRAISILEEAAGTTLEGHHMKASILDNLGNCFVRRFERVGNLIDINQSVLMYKDAVRLTPDGHTEKPSRFSNLGVSLLRRFERLAVLDDTNGAILILEKAVKLTPESSPLKCLRLDNLGKALLHRYERLGNTRDLDMLIIVHHEAVAVTPNGHSSKYVTLKGLGGALLCRFESFGKPDDLNQSVTIDTEAAGLLPVDHPDRPLALMNLSNPLFRRFQHFNNLGDLNQCVSLMDDAVELTPAGHPMKPAYMASLSSFLLERFECLGDISDINRAVSLTEDAARITLDDHNKPTILSTLSGALFNRFEMFGAQDDIDKAVLMMEETVRLTPVEAVARKQRLNNLGILLETRFERGHDINDINRGLSVLEDALQLTPESDPYRATVMDGLATAFGERFKQLNDPCDIDRAVIRLYSVAAGSKAGPAHIRFRSAVAWAGLARVYNHRSLLQAYNNALDLIAEVAWLGLSIPDRHRHVIKADHLVKDAAAAAIAAGQSELAVEWLEQGRSVIWGQLLNLRQPIDDLRDQWPELADKLIFLSAKLEAAGVQRNPLKITNETVEKSLKTISEPHHNYAYERTELLKEIRELEGFSQFILPKKISELSGAAERGPVVVLNVSEFRCDALILMPGLGDEVMHVALPAFTLQDANDMGDSLRKIVSDHGRGYRLVGRREGGFVDPEREFARILSRLWLQVVKPVLDALAITSAMENPQHIWWCPTGPLAFLPIHAAGVYNEQEAVGSKLSDFAISSYVPSLTALIRGLRPYSQFQERLQLLTVAQPSAIGQKYIPGTEDEINRIQQCAKGRIPVCRLVGHQASIQGVEEGMKKCSWVHFACHGVQNRSTPTHSALLLAGDSQLTLERIIQLNLPHADLAFLSACQTATGDKELEEEAVHLAAGMLLAGYRGVIATMWSIMDNDAPHVAADVYEHLFKTSPPDPTRAAEALHLAVKNLCQGSSGTKSFFNWVPFIHVGV
ncbi:CHAT domain-containing protein [Mycena vulgaris]|nr:CHAT domain-containing protein [Mycena vulgaris]